MDCPACKEAMITAELEEVEVDYCAGCGGIWLDAGELELLVDEPGAARAVLDSFVVPDGVKERARRCPICRKRMEKVRAASGEGDVLLDRCRGADGLWFDRGELDRILAAVPFDRVQKVRRVLREMFGKERKA